MHHASIISTQFSPLLCSRPAGRGSKQPSVTEGCRDADTELLPVGELVDAEEALEQEAEDGVALEPFNLAREREEGHFDESGHYVERKEEDDPTAKDAWLASEDGAAAFLLLSGREAGENPLFGCISILTAFWQADLPVPSPFPSRHRPLSY